MNAYRVLQLYNNKQKQYLYHIIIYKYMIMVLYFAVCNSTLLFNYSGATLLNIFGAVLMILLSPLLYMISSYHSMRQFLFIII